MRYLGEEYLASVKTARVGGWQLTPCVCGSGIIAADGSYWREEARKLAGS